ncbi:hypothetical protein PVAP13_9NG018351 [Panicum virgatum]|uniref:Uncharacterized protein n=1 Tax=Panicum virgatum TaxID=38727 RepID=A0A8T0MAQ1_PANVG|nr:hypothetical protein PVAP13_9NG018351 [Panicum virgatum]
MLPAATAPSPSPSASVAAPTPARWRSSCSPPPPPAPAADPRCPLPNPTSLSTPAAPLLTPPASVRHGPSWSRQTCVQRDRQRQRGGDRGTTGRAAPTRSWPRRARLLAYAAALLHGHTAAGSAARPPISRHESHPSNPCASSPPPTPPPPPRPAKFQIDLLHLCMRRSRPLLLWRRVSPSAGA